jgi:hypothetical protein
LEPFERLASQGKRLVARWSIDSFAPSPHRHDLIRCCVSAIVEHEHKCVLSVTASAAVAVVFDRCDRCPARRLTQPTGSARIQSLHCIVLDERGEWISPLHCTRPSTTVTAFLFAHAQRTALNRHTQSHWTSQEPQPGQALEAIAALSTIRCTNGRWPKSARRTRNRTAETVGMMSTCRHVGCPRYSSACARVVCCSPEHTRG